MHTGIAITIRNKQFARRGDAYIRGQAEGIAIVGALLPWRPQRHQQFALAVELMYTMGVALGAKDIVLGIDPDAVCILQDIIAPGVEKITFPVKDDQRVVTARIDKDILFGIGGHGRNPAKGPPCREFAPAFHQLVGVTACAKFHRFLLGVSNDFCVW
jgi:hypothetical protein